MKITYASRKVKKYFSDYAEMQRKLPRPWVRTIKKYMDRLEAAECFGDFQKLKLGQLELLSSYKKPRYSLHVTPNVRLTLS